MSSENFKRDFSRILKSAGDKAEAVVRKTALELQTSMIMLSPVDTGRFRANWQCGVGTVNTDTSAGEDKTGSGSISRTVAALPSWKPGQAIWLSNSMPYAHVLEYGRANGKPGSMQAPNGMVRLTVANYAQALAKAVSETK